MNRSARLVRDSGVLRDIDNVSSYILEVTAVSVGDADAVGYGIDANGREFVIALDLSLAADIASALDLGRRPIVAVESPLYPPLHLMERSQARADSLSGSRR
jgi:hypothetical protein